MLAELAICNAAFAVVKETISSGGDIMAAGQHIFKFFDNKAVIAKKANASGSDSEAFFALEAIKQNEQELQELMQWCGRAGLWDDWLQFQAEAKRKREADAKEQARAIFKRRQEIWGWINGVIIALSVATGFFVVGLLVWAIYNRGQF